LERIRLLEKQWRATQRLHRRACERIAELEAALDKDKQRELTILGWLQEQGTLGQPRIPKNLSRASDQEVPIYEDDLTHFCGQCGTPLQHVRPGKWQCPECE